MAEGGGSSIQAVILGGQDGLVGSLGVILGLAAVGSDPNVVLAGALAAAVASSVSMAAVGYTTGMTERDQYSMEDQRIQRLIAEDPDGARQLLTDLYREKGFQGDLLDSVANVITRDRNSWSRTLMREVSGVQPVEMKDVMRRAFTTGLASIIGALIPILPFLFLNHVDAILAAVIAAAVVLFAVGVWESRQSPASWIRRGVQMVLIGLGAATVGFVIDRFF